MEMEIEVEVSEDVMNLMLMSVRGDRCKYLGGSRREGSSVGKEVERLKGKHRTLSRQ